MAYSLRTKSLEINHKLLHRDILKKLNSINKSQRNTCNNIEISRTTIHRISKEKPIHIDSFLKLILWLNKEANYYLIEKKQ